MEKRVFLIVLDSFGIGAEPDAAAFGDEGTNTLGAIAGHPNFNCPNLKKLGLFNIDGVTAGEKTDAPAGAFARLQEQSMGKDTTIGHWEIAGVVSPNPLPTFPNGFPEELIQEFEAKTGHKVLCNLPYSGTEVLKDYGEQAMKENALIVYTSADSVFQVAAHEELVPVHELYRYCEIAREMLKGAYGVGRVIARPFLGSSAETFYRTTNRHDLSLKPPRATMLDLLKEAGRDVIAVGKIFDIFDGQGVTEKIKTTGNTNGIAFTKALQTRDFEGLAFVNLVDFDMLYGHRRDVPGYAAAATEFDRFLADFIPGMREGDLLMITADHGCDPSAAAGAEQGIQHGGSGLMQGEAAYSTCSCVGREIEGVSAPPVPIHAGTLGQVLRWKPLLPGRRFGGGFCGLLIGRVCSAGMLSAGSSTMTLSGDSSTEVPALGSAVGVDLGLFGGLAGDRSRCLHRPARMRSALWPG